MNKIILVGRLTKDVELNKTQSDISYAHFSIAVDRRYQKDKDNKVCDFINCTAWRGLAETLSNYGKKGKLIAISGSLQINQYETKSGDKANAADVQVEECRFLSGKRDEDQAPKEPSKELEDLTPLPDDLPF